MKIVIGTTIKQQRQLKQWSQQDLAAKLMVTRQTISKWELEKSYPDLESLIRLSELFAVSTDYLLGLVQPVKHRPWLQVLFHKRSTAEMSDIKWYSSGQERGRVAAGIISEIVANLDPATDQPLRELLASYYTEFIEQKSGSNISVFNRMSLAISKCVERNQMTLSPENEQRVRDLLALNYVRYG
ncbi:helix-turn-helix domain-containing protein [Lactiplantibacillus herbarum]|uniref:helix-turn-helix domain-containing protein n=1 Tax=Lactiplantibacillus herbarum TaxID=1670446 RepID=UPI00064FFE01|nr:helix-turn-helix domain-containing protein [Lactiplantibacillus herbarum]